MLVHKEGTIVVLKRFNPTTPETLLCVVVGYENGIKFKDIYKKKIFLLHDKNNHSQTLDVLEVVAYNQDKWQNFLKSIHATPSHSCYVDVTKNKGINNFFQPYQYQFKDLVVRTKDIPHGVAFSIEKIHWQGLHAIDNNKRRKAKLKNKGFRITLQPIIRGKSIVVNDKELEKYFDLYE